MRRARPALRGRVSDRALHIDVRLTKSWLTLRDCQIDDVAGRPDGSPEVAAHRVSARTVGNGSRGEEVVDLKRFMRLAAVAPGTRQGFRELDGLDRKLPVTGTEREASYRFRSSWSLPPDAPGVAIGRRPWRGCSTAEATTRNS